MGGEEGEEGGAPAPFPTPDPSFFHFFFSKNDFISAGSSSFPFTIIRVSQFQKQLTDRPFCPSKTV